MLTDDDLTTELRAAFRDATGDLQYAGKVPTPRHRPAIAVPAAATVAAVATLAVVWANAPGAEAPGPEATPSHAPAHARQVTDTIEVAGYSFTYRHAPGEQRDNDLYAMLGDIRLPADAQPIDAPGKAEAWIGTDAESGDHGVWVRTVTRNGGSMFAVLSPTWTTDELRDLLFNGSSED